MFCAVVRRCVFSTDPRLGWFQIDVKNKENANVKVQSYSLHVLYNNTMNKLQVYNVYINYLECSCVSFNEAVSVFNQRVNPNPILHGYRLYIGLIIPYVVKNGKML